MVLINPQVQCRDEIPLVSGEDENWTLMAVDQSISVTDSSVILVIFNKHNDEVIIFRFDFNKVKRYD